MRIAPADFWRMSPQEFWLLFGRWEEQVDRVGTMPRKAFNELKELLH